MKRQNYSLRISARRLSAALVAANLMATPFAALAQAPPKAVKKPDNKKPAPKPPTKGGVKPAGGGGLRVVPMPTTGNVIIAPPLNPPVNPPPGGGATITFDYRGADIMNVLRFYAQVASVNVTVDPGLSGQVTIINPKPITIEEAFKVLQSVLFVRGFTAIRNGNVLSVVPMAKGIKITPLVSPGLDENGKPKTDAGGQVMTQVIPLENVDAEALAKELLPLISEGANLVGSSGNNVLILTDIASNIDRFIRLVDALDKTANNAVMKTYFLRRSDAATITEVINNLYKQITSRGRGGGAQPGQPPPQPGQPQPSSGRPAVVAVADTRMNAVIVVASQDNHEQIAKNIINRLDDDEGILDTKTRKLKFADAADVANTVNTILTNMRPGGGGGGGNPSFGGRAFGGFDPFGGGGGNQQSVNSTDPMGKVTADARTNTLFITASPEKMRKIEELIDKVDVDVPVETTTFIFPLKNAPAQDVAEALTQAFSTGRQNNGFGGFFFGGFGGGGSSRSTQRRQRINRKFGQDDNNNNPFGRSAPVPPPNAPDGRTQGDGGNNTQGGSAIPQGIQGVMTPNGFVPSYSANDSNGDERTRQYYDYYGRGRQSGIGQNRGPQYGRGRAGGYSNLLQLQNNVFVTPSPGGDSIIVTTTPDNYNVLKSLIEQLDKVQRQVVIECIIAEVTLESNEKLGMALGGTFSRLFKGTNEAKIRANLPMNGGSNVFDANGGGTQFSLKGVNYDALVQALTTDNKVKILSTPRIFTTNNQEAQIELVTQIPYITSQNQGIFGGGGVGQEVKFVEPGLFLNVIPSITRDGMVTIDVLQEASELLRFDNLGTGISTIRAPVTNLRSANTLVTIQDNETVAIGGLIRENYSTTINKVPILSELPFVGQLFRSRERQKSRVELVIFLTPRIVSTVQDARDMTFKDGASIIRDIPDIKKFQPSLDTKGEKKPEERRKEKKPEEKGEEAPKREETSETTEPPETP